MTLQRNKLFKSIVTFKIKYQFGSKPTFLGHDAGSFGGEIKSNKYKGIYLWGKYSYKFDL